MSGNAEMLTDAFRTVGRKYGYEKVEAEFATFREFKVQWQRSYRWASFRVSDYLEDAGRNVIEGLADTLFQRITGRESTPYDESMREFVTAEDFAERKRPAYLRRSRNLTSGPEGLGRNLEDSVERLKDMGLWQGYDDIKCVWATGVRARKAATCSVLMKLISIADLLDDTEIPDMVVDYSVYTQYLRIAEGQKCFGRGDIYTREQERQFPKYKEAERLLDKLCLYI